MLILKVLQKIKVTGEINDYCLIEHLEYEQYFPKQVSISENETTNSFSSSANNLNLSQSNITKTSNNKRLTVKTRILAPNENLFILTHVWNNMKTEKKDGFKYAKIILTKRKTVAKLHDANLRQQASLLSKHRMSLQPTTQSPKNLPLVTAVKQHANKAALSAKLPTPETSCGSQATTSSKSLAVNQKRAKSSLNRLVRQKSFEESMEKLNMGLHLQNNQTAAGQGDENDLVASTTVTTTTTTTDHELFDLSERRMSGKKVTEVVESTLALSTEIITMPSSSKNDEDDDDENESNQDENETIQKDEEEEDDDEYRSETRKKSIFINEQATKSSHHVIDNAEKSDNSNSNKKFTAPQRRSTLQRLLKLKF